MILDSKSQQWAEPYRVSHGPLAGRLRELAPVLAAEREARIRRHREEAQAAAAAGAQADRFAARSQRREQSQRARRAAIARDPVGMARRAERRAELLAELAELQEELALQQARVQRALDASAGSVISRAKAASRAARQGGSRRGSSGAVSMTRAEWADWSAAYVRAFPGEVTRTAPSAFRTY